MNESARWIFDSFEHNILLYFGPAYSSKCLMGLKTNAGDIEKKLLVTIPIDLTVSTR